MRASAKLSRAVLRIGIGAVVLTGALLVGTRAISAETFLFYAFSATALIAGALLVTQRNPARAALSFALVVLSTCGLFLLLAAPFLMAATAIVYGGVPPLVPAEQRERPLVFGVGRNDPDVGIRFRRERAHCGTGLPAPGEGPVFYQTDPSPAGDQRVTQQGYSGANPANAGKGTVQP